MKLLYRKEKHRDEGIYDYICRVSYFNGYRTQIEFIESLLNYYKNLVSTSIFRRIESIPDSRYDSVFWYQCITALEYILKITFDPSELCLDISKPRAPSFEGENICPVCWMESRYIRFYWHYEHYDVCHYHDVMIIKVDRAIYDSSFVVCTTDVVKEKRALPRNSSFEFDYLKCMGSQVPSGEEISLAKRLSYEESAFQFRVYRFIYKILHMDLGWKKFTKFLYAENFYKKTIEERLESYRDMFCQEVSGHGLNKDIANAVFLVFLYNDHFLRGHARVNTWCLSEAYAVHPTLYILLGGVSEDTFFIVDGVKNIDLPAIRVNYISGTNVVELIESWERFGMHSVILQFTAYEYEYKYLSLPPHEFKDLGTYEVVDIIDFSEIFDDQSLDLFFNSLRVKKGTPTYVKNANKYEKYRKYAENDLFSILTKDEAEHIVI